MARGNGKPASPQVVGQGKVTIHATFFDDGQCQTRIDWESIRGGAETVENIWIANMQNIHAMAIQARQQAKDNEKRVQIAHQMPRGLQ